MQRDTVKGGEGVTKYTDVVIELIMQMNIMVTKALFNWSFGNIVKTLKQLIK